MTEDDQPLDEAWSCGAFEPVVGRQPFRCSLSYGHQSDHQAVVDGAVAAEWPRRDAQ